MNWRRPGLLVFVLCWAAYLSNCRTLPYNSGADTIPNRLVPFSILRGHTHRMDMFRDDIYRNRVFSIFPKGDSLISMYPIGTSLAALPVYVPIYAFLSVGGKPSPHTLFVMSEHAEKYAAATITAFAVWFFWLTARRMLSQRQAFWMAIAFGLGTLMWGISSQMLWQQCVVSASITAALYFLMWPGLPYRAVAGAGFAMSMAVSARPTAGLFFLAGLIAAMIIARRDWFRTAFLYCSVAAPVILVTLVINYRDHGHLSGFYHEILGKILAGIFTKWAVRGVHGLLLSPNRGLLIFTPIAFFGIFGLAMQLIDRKHRNPVLLSFGIASLIHLVISGAFEGWWGGWSFGPRYLVDILPILALAATDIWNRLPQWSRRAAVVLLVWSIVVQVDGAFFYPASEWNGRMLGPDSIKGCYSWSNFELWQDYQAWRKRDVWSTPYAY